MPSKIRETALRYDLGATLWRNAMTKDNEELNGLNVEQLIMLEARYPEGCIQREEIRRIINIRSIQKEAHGT